MKDKIVEILKKHEDVFAFDTLSVRVIHPDSIPEIAEDITNLYSAGEDKESRQMIKDGGWEDTGDDTYIPTVSEGEVHPVKFGRWLLKYATPHYDEEGLVCWLYGTVEYDTHELYERFKELNR